jgi:PAS domain S-box-containing protein
MPLTPTPVLLVASDDDLAAVRAGARGVEIFNAGSLDEARTRLATLPPLSAVLLSLGRAPDPAAWAALLSGTPHAQASLVALVTQAQLPSIARWLEQGGHDWLVVDQPGAMQALFLRLSLARSRDRARAESDERLRLTSAELMLLARSPRFRGNDLDAALAEVTEAGTRGLAVARCGVWLLDDPRQVLTLVDVFDARSGQHARGESLPTASHPNYFATLLDQRLISASNAQEDPRLREFNDQHHLPLGITSVIDVAVRRRGELVGVLCLEHVGPRRQWTTVEEGFAGALADLVSLALEGAERDRVEAALQQTERRFRDLFEHTSDATVLYRVALDGKVFCEDFNPAAEAGSGFKREQLIGRQAHEVVEAGSAQKLAGRFAQAIRTRLPVLYEDSLELPRGTRWYNTAIVPLLDQTGRVDRLAAIARDITAAREAEQLQRRLEAEVAEAQKSEALARLASHIAHDVNNVLTIIVAHAQRLLQLPGKPSEVAQAILQATVRGRELTQQVLTFGRRRPPERKPLDVGEVVRETVALFAATAPSVTMRVELDVHTPRVQGDGAQLHQVVTNLFTNALHAMTQGDGALTVRLAPIDVDYAFARLHPPLQAGQWVRLSVSDTGVGMDESTRRRIFEPFFSTRPEGRGTGLGLAVVQSIVQGHDGAVEVDTTPGQGSTFHVYLPALEEESSRPGSGQHLMLVDDHPGMARVSARLLETLGYRTSVFDDPREALAAFRATPDTYDAVLTDLSMPQMSGEELTRSVREVKPDLPVIVSSGMASELNEQDLERLGFAAVLMKPWRLEEAVSTLKRVLPPR